MGAAYVGELDKDWSLARAGEQLENIQPLD